MVAWFALLLGCGGTEPTPERSASSATVPAPGSEARPIDPPAAAGALAPNVAPLADGIALTWLEPGGDDDHKHHMRFARLVGEEWSSPVTITAGDTFFANWADLPGMAVTGDGSLVAWWLAKTGADTYAYSIFLARSTDGGQTWSRLGRLPADESETEHGFVSAVAEGAGTRFFWLDGREMAQGGAMGLRTGTLDRRAGETLLDGRTCECCATDAALATAGPVIAYRDRSTREIRDVVVVRRTAAGWSAPTTVHSDGWEIPGCPVNGPAIDVVQDHVAVAWFTAAGGQGRVLVAFSRDGGESFQSPLVLDASDPLGRVDLVMTDDGAALVSWLGTTGGGAVVRLARAEPNGRLGSIRELAHTSAARSSGFPRLAIGSGRVLVVWVEAAEDRTQRVRALLLPAT